MKQISIVIPAYNEEKFIGKTIESIQSIHYPRDHFEIIVVSDGSTDQTNEIIKKIQGVRLIELPENVGRVKCRQKGAETALYPNILFIDSHAVVDPEILTILNRLDAEVVSGYILGTEKITPFETFYLSIRKIIFFKFYRNYNIPFYLTPDNFDSMPKGTTALYVTKERLFDAYAELSQANIDKYTSDDIKLLRAIVKQVPILVHPAVKITYYARTSFRASIKHLFERGPKFVDYYLDPSKRYFWLVIIFPLFVIFSTIAAMLLLPLLLPIKILTLVCMDVILTLLLARSLREFFTIFYMLPLCAAVFYAGVIMGIFVKLLRTKNIIASQS